HYTVAFAFPLSSLLTVSGSTFPSAPTKLLGVIEVLQFHRTALSSGSRTPAPYRRPHRSRSISSQTASEWQSGRTTCEVLTTAFPTLPPPHDGYARVPGSSLADAG